MAAAPEPLLRVFGLRVLYGERIEALRGVSLEVRAGEAVALIGSNGAGKTTLLKALSALLPAAAGTVSFAGRPLAGLRAHAIARLGLTQIPEGRRLFARMSVRENLELGAHATGAAAGLDAAFALFPLLRERQGQAAGTLSGGEQQMLAVGRAMMARPRLLLLDEPSMGLSPKAADAVYDALARIRDSGVAMLLVEQNARRALELAPRAYVLETGRIALEGPSAELARDPAVRRAYLGL